MDLFNGIELTAFPTVLNNLVLLLTFRSLLIPSGRDCLKSLTALPDSTFNFCLTLPKSTLWLIDFNELTCLDLDGHGCWSTGLGVIAGAGVLLFSGVAFLKFGDGVDLESLLGTENESPWKDADKHRFEETNIFAAADISTPIAAPLGLGVAGRRRSADCDRLVRLEAEAGEGVIAIRSTLALDTIGVGVAHLRNEEFDTVEEEVEEEAEAEEEEEVERYREVTSRGFGRRRAATLFPVSDGSSGGLVRF